MLFCTIQNTHDSCWPQWHLAGNMLHALHLPIHWGSCILCITPHLKQYMLSLKTSYRLGLICKSIRKWWKMVRGSQEISKWVKTNNTLSADTRNLKGCNKNLLSKWKSLNGGEAEGLVHSQSGSYLSYPSSSLLLPDGSCYEWFWLCWWLPADRDIASAPAVRKWKQHPLEDLSVLACPFHPHLSWSDFAPSSQGGSQVSELSVEQQEGSDGCLQSHPVFD